MRSISIETYLRIRINVCQHFIRDSTGGFVKSVNQLVYVVRLRALIPQLTPVSADF